jgi:hypothetical protein
MQLNAVLIDPVAMTVIDTDVEQDNIHDIYKAIGVDCFDVARVHINFANRLSEVSVFVDDEGLLKPDRSYFGLKADTGTTTLAGKGLVLGPPSRDGRAQGCLVSASQLRPYVVFYISIDGLSGYVDATAVAAARMRGLLIPPAWRDSDDRTAFNVTIKSSSEEEK